MDEQAQITTDAHRQEVAGRCHLIILQALMQIQAAAQTSGLVGQSEGGVDAAPVVQGAMGAIVQFLIDGGAAEADSRLLITESLDTLMKQIVFAREAEKMGASVAGHA